MPVTPLTLKECAEAARLHQAAFYKGWGSEDFQAFLNDPLIFGLKVQSKEELCGYILWREVQMEAEILTLVVGEPFQRLGFGHLLLETLLAHLKTRGISKLFLEVAEDNVVAQSFYLKHGFTLLGKRPKYYERPDNTFMDGLNFVRVIGGRYWERSEAIQGKRY